MRRTVVVKQIVHDCNKNRSVKRTELGVGGGGREVVGGEMEVEVKLLWLGTEKLASRSNWGGRPRGYVVGELGPSRERVVGGGWVEGRKRTEGGVGGGKR